MKTIKNNYGKSYKVINDFSIVDIDDLIHIEDGQVKFKTITLFMFNGFSNKILKEYKEGNITLYFENTYSDIKFLGENHLPLTMKLEREESNFGVIEINPLVIALNLFDVEYSEYESNNLILNDMINDKNIQKNLIKEIEKIIYKISKKENITDIIIGSYSFEDEFTNSVDMKSEYKKYTVSELADIWGVKDATIITAILNGKFDKKEIEKRGGIWFISKHQMEEVFGDYASLKIRKIKREISNNDIDKESKNIIKKLSEEFCKNIHVEDFNYEDFKSDILKGIEKSNLYLIEEKLKTLKKVNYEYLDYIISKKSLILYIYFFEKLFKDYNKIINGIKDEIIDIYYMIKHDYEYNETKDKYKFSTRYYDRNNQYIKEFKLKIMGLTKKDFINENSGIQIGTVDCILHNFSKMIKNDAMEDIYTIMDSWSEESRKLCIMIFGEGFNSHNMNLIGEKQNLLYIKNMNIKNKYSRYNVREKIIKSIEAAVDYLFDYEVGTLAVDSRDEFEALGFTELNNGEYSIMFLNTDEFINSTEEMLSEKADSLEYIDYTKLELNSLEIDLLIKIIEERISSDTNYLEKSVEEKSIDEEDIYYCEKCIQLCKDILQKIKSDAIYLNNDELEQLTIIVYIAMQNLDKENSNYEVLNELYNKYKNNDKY